LSDTSRSRGAGRGWLIAAAAIVAAVTLLGAWGAVRVVGDERARDLRTLQLRLGATADARAGAVADWVSRQREALRGLADNQTLQLYLTELAIAGGDRTRVTDETSQATFVRSLLVVAAERLGFVPLRSGIAINANVARPGGAGFVVLDQTLRPLIATGDLPAVEGRLRALAESARAGLVFDLVAGADGRALFVAAAPVTPLQGETNARPVGVILGVRDADPDLFQLLDRPPGPERSAETVLLRPAGALVELLSPLRDGTRPFGRSIDRAAGTVEVVAATSPGGFVMQRDIRDVPVVAVSRRIAGTDWVIAHKLARDEALGESDARLWRLLLVLLLAAGGLALTLVAVWRHGASRRARDAARVAQDLARRFAAQGELLRLVTDNQPADIFIVDSHSRLRFANRRLAERSEAQVEDLQGKRMTAVFGPVLARRYEDALRATLARGAAQTLIERTERDGAVTVTRAELVPVTVEDGPAMLVVEEDITGAVVEREKRARILQQIVDALVRLLDRRDPFAANHSERVAAVARAIALELDLPEQTVDTTETAGRLMNLGKALVPESLLTRQGSLSAAEHRQVHEALQHGVELLRDIEFGGPVVETLRQARERWDGAGPGRLAGEAILMPARIIAVANSFVAMVSERAHRPGSDIDAALAATAVEAGRLFDRRVVAALANVIENRGGRARFATATPPNE
jgi:HD-GYP domain-containing protein (c-di-GMP phosphodiesterase class II)